MFLKLLKKIPPAIIAALLAAFGLLTLFLSTSLIFDLFGVRASQGDYVFFVVLANFISSIIYIFAAYGLLKTKKWAIQLLTFSVIVLMIAFVGLFIHIIAGGLYETKTIGALTFRIIVTLGFIALAFFTISKKK